MCYSLFRKWKLSKSSLVETRSCVGTSPNLLTGKKRRNHWSEKRKKKGTRADLLIFNHLSGRLNMSSTPRVQTTPFKVNFGSFYKLSNKNNIPYGHTSARGRLAVAVWTQVLWFSVMLGYRTKVIFLFLFFMFHLFPVFIFRLTSNFRFIACIKVGLIFSVQISTIPLTF